MQVVQIETPLCQSDLSARGPAGGPGEMPLMPELSDSHGDGASSLGRVVSLRLIRA